MPSRACAKLRILPNVAPIGKFDINSISGDEKYGTLHEFACHPCAGAMLIFSVSFQFYYMYRRSEYEVVLWPWCLYSGAPPGLWSPRSGALQQLPRRRGLVWGMRTPFPQAARGSHVVVGSTGSTWSTGRSRQWLRKEGHGGGVWGGFRCLCTLPGCSWPFAVAVGAPARCGAGGALSRIIDNRR